MWRETKAGRERIKELELKCGIEPALSEDSDYEESMDFSDTELFDDDAPTTTRPSRPNNTTVREDEMLVDPALLSYVITLPSS